MAVAVMTVMTVVTVIAGMLVVTVVPVVTIVTVMAVVTGAVVAMVDAEACDGAPKEPLNLEAVGERVRQLEALLFSDVGALGIRRPRPGRSRRVIT